jgi:membrane-associated phospholipid phosphatase
MQGTSMAKLMDEHAGNANYVRDVRPANNDHDQFRRHWHYSTKIMVLSTFVVAVNVFYWLAFYIKANAPISAERSFLLFLHQYEMPLLNHLALALCTLVTTLSVTVLLYLLYRRRWQSAAFWFAATAGSALLSGIAKKIVHRVRPELWDLIAPQSSFGFPSGHATESMAIFVAALCIVRTPKMRMAVVPMAAVFVPLVGLCRMYLGVHYPTDIFAGWALSLAWVSALGIAFNLFNKDVDVPSGQLLHESFFK